MAMQKHTCRPNRRTGKEPRRRVNEIDALDRPATGGFDSSTAADGVQQCDLRGSDTTGRRRQELPLQWPVVHVEPGDLLVARVWRWDAERLRLDAERDHAVDLAAGIQNPEYSISVFARRHQAGEDIEAAMRDLCQRINRRAQWVAFTTDRILRGKGFELRRNEPPPDHYDVLLGSDLARADVAGLEAVFSEHPRRRFPSCQLPSP